jgi:hypothetical protein
MHVENLLNDSMNYRCFKFKDINLHRSKILKDFEILINFFLVLLVLIYLQQ